MAKLYPERNDGEAIVGESDAAPAGCPPPGIMTANPHHQGGTPS